MQQNRDAEALVMLGRITRHDPSYADALVHRGVLFFKMGQTERATQCLEEAINLDPINPDAFHYLGVIALETDDPKRAYENLSRACELGPEDADLLANLGVVQHDLGDAAGAEYSLKRCLDIEPGHTHALCALSNLYLDTNARDRYRAYADFDRFIHCSAPLVASTVPDKDEFQNNLAGEIYRCASLQDSPRHRSTIAGASTDPIMGRADSAVEILRHMFISEAQSYAASLECDAHHPLAKLGKRVFSTNMWGNVLGAGGHQKSHSHPDAWLSGIYYVSVPDEVGARGSGQNGWIEFGRPRDEYHGANQLDLRLIRPMPGMMILFPSYVWHRTLPLVGDADRISVAIDFIPQADTAGT